MKKSLYYSLPLLLCFLFFWGLSKHPTDKSLVDVANATFRSVVVGGGVGACTVDCTGSFGCEAWDGGDCNAEGWTTAGTGASINCAAAAIGCGKPYEVSITSGTDNAYVYKDFGDQVSEAFVKFEFRFDTNFAGNDLLTRIYDSFNSPGLAIHIRNDDGDKMRAYHGTVNNLGNTALAPNTWYTLKYRYLADPGGGNGQGWVWLAEGQGVVFDTTCTANCDIKITNGDDTDTVDELYLYSSDDTSQSTFRFDNVWVGTSDPDA